MISNEEAIKILHDLSDNARKVNYKSIYELTEEVCLSLDLGASAIKTIDDMSDIFQKLITLTPSDIDTLTTFLKTHSVSEVVSTLDYLNTKLHSSSKYGSMVYADTDSIKIDVSRETSESEDT